MWNIARLVSKNWGVANIFIYPLLAFLLLEVVTPQPTAWAADDEGLSQHKASTQLGDFYYQQAHRIIEETIRIYGSDPLGNGTAPGSAPTSATAAAYDALKRAAHYGHPAAQHELATALWHGVFFDLIVPMEPGR
jgi:hypothetical protein